MTQSFTRICVKDAITDGKGMGFGLYEADCVVFIIDGQIGAQTLEEFNISFNSFRYRQKPSILVYSKNERNSHPQTEAFISNMNKVKHYWRVYTDIISLKLKFKEDITNELINLL